MAEQKVTVRFSLEVTAMLWAIVIMLIFAIGGASREIAQAIREGAVIQQCVGVANG